MLADIARASNSKRGASNRSEDPRVAAALHSFLGLPPAAATGTLQHFKRDACRHFSSALSGGSIFLTGLQEPKKIRKHSCGNRQLSLPGTDRPVRLER
jgi:hypothetical protein